MRRSWASRSLVGALLLVACGRSGSGTPGSGSGGAGAVAGAGGGGTAGAGAVGTAGAGTAGAGTAGAGGGTAGAGSGGSSGRGGSTNGGAGGSGAGGSAPGVAGASGTAGTSGTAGSPGTCLPHDIDIPSTVITGTITVQGVPSPITTGLGTLDLRTAAGDNVRVGDTQLGLGPQTLLPGTYDLYYRNDAGGKGLPVNQSAKIQSGIVVPRDLPATLDVVIPATAVSGTITQNGAIPVFTSNALHFRNASGDDAILGTLGSNATFATVVVPGTYDLYYTNTSALAASNTSTKLQSGIVVGSSPVTLTVEVPVTKVSGTFTVGGSTTRPAGSTDAYGIFLRNAGDNAEIASSLGVYSSTVIQGTYDVYYGVYSGETQYAQQQTTQLQSGLVVGSTPLTMNFDVPVTTLSGKITVNGTQVTEVGSVLILRNATDTRPFANVAPGTYSTRVVPGTYDLYYANKAPGTGLPSNASVKLRSDVVVAGSAQTLDIDIPATTVTGTIRVNGVQVDVSMGSGGLHLRNAAGDDALLATTGVAGGYSQLVVAGTYDLYYAVINSGAGVPINQSAKVRSGIVVGSAPITLDIDVVAPMVSGTLSENGMLFPATFPGGGIGNLVLQNASGDKATLASTYSNSYARLVIAGTYDLKYTISTLMFGIPYNKLGALGCYTVP